MIRKAAIGITLMSFAFVWGCGTQTREKTPYLDAAVAAGRWMQSLTSVPGTVPDEVLGEQERTIDLGAGASGRIIFFLELFHATGDSTFLTSATREGEAVFQALRAGVLTEQDPGLYRGLAGIAFAMNELGAASGRELYRDAARAIGRHLEHENKTDDNEGVYWNDASDVMTGTAGIGLTMLYLSRELRDEVLRGPAVGAGQRLINLGHRTKEGWWWFRGPGYEFNLPNFSHGTAGIGYFLATLYEETGDSRFLEGGMQASLNLIDIADRRDSLLLVPYGLPNIGYDTPYGIGWAHGPAGTARLFYRLWLNTQDPEYLRAVDACARTIIASGVPGPSADTSLWHDPFRIDRRFGTSGAADFLIDYFEVTSDTTALDVAHKIADDLLSRASGDSAHTYWVIPRYEFQENEGQDAAFTGYFYGTSGIGLMLLHLHYADHDQKPSIRIPDDPF